jgi:hypothetical protein
MHEQHQKEQHDMTQTARNLSNDEPLFQNVGSALAFAFNYSAQFPQTAIGKMMREALGRGSRPQGRGLAGLDGAGQAGMMLAEVDRLPGMMPVMLRLRFGSCEDQCPDYMEKVPCMEWTNALGTLTRSIEARLVNDPMLRRFIVAQLVRGVSVSKITAYEPISIICDRAPRTLRRHISELRDQLRILAEDAMSAAEVRFIDLGWL